jgi:hypothetical protein
MPSLENRNGSYRVVFRLLGRKFSRTLRTRNAKTARGTFARLEDNLRRVELGTLVIPSGANVPTFLLSDGNAQHLARQTATIPELTLAGLFSRYSAHLPEESLEKNTLAMIQIHLRHLLKVFGGTFPVRNMDGSRVSSEIRQSKSQRQGPARKATYGRSPCHHRSPRFFATGARYIRAASSRFAAGWT